MEGYSRKPTSLNENDEIDKRTVLDLCAHMFHPKENHGNGGPEIMSSSNLDYNDMR